MFYHIYIPNKFYLLIIRRFSSSILSECHVFLIHPNHMLRGTIVCAAAVRHRTPKFLYQKSHFGMTNLAVDGGGPSEDVK